VTSAGTALLDGSSINADTITADDANLRLVARQLKGVVDALLAHGIVQPPA
jgi:hypothetical protein